MNRKGIEFSFAWIFAIIVGAAIIFMGIYATTSIINSGKSQIDAQTSAELGIFLNPLSTGLEEGKVKRIEFIDETRIYNGCDERGSFGSQRLSTSTRSNIGEEWQEPITEQVFYDKYIFSEGVVEGKKFEIFVKPFEMPFKVADMVYIYSDNYCFVNPPMDVEDEIRLLGLENTKIVNSKGECRRDEKMVCFSSAGCEVEVYAGSGVDSGSSGTVKKDGVTVKYSGVDLMLGAIYSDGIIYECELARLMKRTGELAQVYASKADFLEGRGCATGLSGDLRSYALSSQIEDSFDIENVMGLSENIRRKNEFLQCKLF